MSRQDAKFINTEMCSRHAGDFSEGCIHCTLEIMQDQITEAQEQNTDLKAEVERLREATKEHCSTHSIDPAFRCDLEPCDLCKALNHKEE